jgi:transcriptional regulator with XRE-family HTH domain
MHAAAVEDHRVGTLLRALRRRRGLRQADCASRADVSQSTWSRAERGHLDSLPLRTLRRMFGVLDARVHAEIRWRGGDLERLADSAHARLVADAAAVLVADGWTVLQEITYSIYGERGSIDLVGVRATERAALVLEAKTELASWEETQRQFDAKVRLAPSVLRDRIGWRPMRIGRVIVFLESATTRRRLEALGPAVAHVYPDRARAVRAWLRSPATPLAAIWFLSGSHARTVIRAAGGTRRIRTPRDAPLPR